jgi:hypothetical protein
LVEAAFPPAIGALKTRFNWAAFLLLSILKSTSIFGQKMFLGRHHRNKEGEDFMCPLLVEYLEEVEEHQDAVSHNVCEL